MLLSSYFCLHATIENPEDIVSCDALVKKNLSPVIRKLLKKNTPQKIETFTTFDAQTTATALYEFTKPHLTDAHKTTELKSAAQKYGQMLSKQFRFRLTTKKH